MDYTNMVHPQLKPVINRLNSLLAKQDVFEPKYRVMIEEEQGFGFARVGDKTTDRALDALRESGELQDILEEGMTIINSIKNYITY